MQDPRIFLLLMCILPFPFPCPMAARKSKDANTCIWHQRPTWEEQWSPLHPHSFHFATDTCVELNTSGSWPYSNLPANWAHRLQAHLTYACGSLGASSVASAPRSMGHFNKWSLHSGAGTPVQPPDNLSWGSLSVRHIHLVNRQEWQYAIKRWTTQEAVKHRTWSDIAHWLLACSHTTNPSYLLSSPFSHSFLIYLHLFLSPYFTSSLNMP